ncbi:hypothetical protein [Aldersonia kunmingensis]|uniref:hypothetical protein n=1 Tax=Aldersonia kunmingensis TaxID=408066 RepID=UPI0012EDD0D4|nr:hypothetical protein [Aldersonia kunmingensis]
MIAGSEQLGSRRVGRSKFTLLGVGVLATGLVLGSAGVAAAAPVSGANSAVDTEWEASWAAYQFEASQAASLLVTKNVDLPITINAPIDRVFTAYSNFNNSFGRHPFLKGVLDRRKYTEGGAEVWEFIALEDIPLGPISIPGRTVGKQRMYAAEHWYSTETWDLPGVITRQKITFAKDGDSTVVTEHLSFSAPAVLIDYTVQNGVDAHIVNQKAVKRDIENGML